jgi:hypothetical protein
MKFVGCVQYWGCVTIMVPLNYKNRNHILFLYTHLCYKENRRTSGVVDVSNRYTSNVVGKSG